jgi:flagellar biosynthesis protein
MTTIQSQTAIALEYDQLSAPTVSAQGHDEIAEQIITIARENGVPLYQNPELARLLMTLEIGDAIPEDLYVCIAQVIAFAYKIKNKYPADWEAPEQPVDKEAGLTLENDNGQAALPKPGDHED